MKAMIYHDYGSPDVLELQEIERPVIKDDELLVKVHAASLNWLDWHFLTGRPSLARLMAGLLKPKNQVLGIDLAVRVEPGQKVLINAASGGVGTFAVQITRSLGAVVTGVCSIRNLDLARSLGVDQVIDYTRDDFTHNEGCYDLIFIRELLERGQVIPTIDRCYPLCEVPDALRYLEMGHARGKVVIAILAGAPSLQLTS